MHFDIVPNFMQAFPLIYTDLSVVFSRHLTSFYLAFAVLFVALAQLVSEIARFLLLGPNQ